MSRRQPGPIAADFPGPIVHMQTATVNGIFCLLVIDRSGAAWIAPDFHFNGHVACWNPIPGTGPFKGE